MNYLKFKQIKFREVAPNEPFYLINPNQNKNAKVHFPAKQFGPDEKVWVINSKVMASFY
jgi:hypothetical protein